MSVAMEEEEDAAPTYGGDTSLDPKSYSTVDPEVRAYVYSLVSAVGQCATSLHSISDNEK